MRRDMRRDLRRDLRIVPIAALLTFIVATSAAAQQPRGQNLSSYFNFDRCYSQCLNLGGSPGSCQAGCADRAATLARTPVGGSRNPNDNPNSPRFNDAEPRRPTW